jgi:hypothetical protein
LPDHHLHINKPKGLKEMLEKAQQLKEQFTEKVNSASASAELEQLRIELKERIAKAYNAAFPETHRTFSARLEVEPPPA